MQYSNRVAFAMAWNFFKGNYALNFAVVAILIVLKLLGMLPVIGLLFIFGYSILELSIQIFFGRKAKEVVSEEDMQYVAAETKIGEYLSAYLPQASGAFLALFLLALVFIALFGVIVASSGSMKMVSEQALMQGQMAQVLLYVMGSPSILLFLVVAILFYFFPAMMGKVFKSEDFVAAFKSVFLLFSPTLWKSTFNKDYFVLIFIWSIIVTIAVVLIVLMMGTVLLIPVGLILAYLLSLYNAAVYVYAEELAR